MFEVQWYWVEVTPVVNAGFLFFSLCLLWFADPKSQFTEHLSLIPFACRCRWRNVVKERQDKGSEPQTKVIRHSCPSLQVNKARVTATEGPLCPRKEPPGPASPGPPARSPSRTPPPATSDHSPASTTSSGGYSSPAHRRYYLRTRLNKSQSAPISNLNKANEIEFQKNEIIATKHEYTQKN